MHKPIYIAAALIALFSFTFVNEKRVPVVERPIVIEQAPIKREPESFTITSMAIDRYLKIEEVTDIMKIWSREAPAMTEFGTVGKTRSGREIPYLKIGRSGPKVLIHAAIHGNERISTSCTLYIMNSLLAHYGKDDDVTKLLDTRQIYFVPILSVDSYVSQQRFCEGVDPNRNYPCPENPNQVSVSPLLAIQNFHKQHKFSGVISGHSFGRVYLYPRFGPDREAIKSLGEEMGKISGYGTRPIGGGYPSRSPGSRGYDVDWYYWKGAVSLLTEFGAGSHNMNPAMLKDEANRNYNAYILFIKKAPEIKLIGFKNKNG